MSTSIVPSTPTSSQEPAEPTIYQQLIERFDQTFTDPRGFEYITGEQVVSRLNDTLGVFGWTFEVLANRHDTEADEIVVQGRLRVYDPQSGQWITREQFGSQKINRKRDSGRPIEIGFDHKGAATDCLKKCASLFGVGLYLYAKESRIQATSPREAPAPAPQARPQPSVVQVQPVRPSAPPQLPPPCSDCGKPLQRVEFAGGEVWDAFRLANQGLAKFKRPLCMTCYRAANAAAKSSV